MRTSYLLSVVALLSLSAGCVAKKAEEAAPPPPPPMSQVLPNIPMPPGAQPVTTESGADATQMILLTAVPPDSVVEYYRRVLGDPPFHLVNETTKDGVTSFLADQNGPSLWVTVQPNGEKGSQVILAGAVVDSARKAAAAGVKAKSAGEN